MYKKGDVVVYRRNVCRVVGKGKSDFTGEQCYFLELYHDEGGTARMQVPVANKGGHLRDLITKPEIKKLMAMVDDIDCLENKPANMKSQYAALLKGDGLDELICIIKTSYLRNKERMDTHKKLASIDGEYLEKAERYLFNEFSVAMNCSYDKAKEYFIKELNKPKAKKTKKK